MSTDTVKEYLDHPMTQTTVDMIVADTLPIIKEHFEREDVSPWEIATALVVLLSSVTNSTELDQDAMVELATFIMQTTKDQGLFSSQH
jgi:hypothetical protein|tara:strand:+ start:670 stop:933 length:264 start_codon:yes stop_codon:yes gene_type:complete